jgi:Circularly permutated YpsA SLOG family
MNLKILSGGQTGVDRAAQDAAMVLGLPCGGWCPKGRRAEDGAIPAKYQLEETPSLDYRQRTEWNVRDSDGTLILTVGPVSGGTALTAEFAEKHNRPCLIVDLATAQSADAVRGWIEQNRIRILNVAGPRESKQPGIYQQVAVMLRQILAP